MHKIKLTFKSFVFGLLSILLFCNVNGIINNLFGVEAVLSPLILALSFCLMVIVRPKKKLFSTPFFSFILTLVSLWYFGIISGIIHYDETNFKNVDLFHASRLIFTSCLIFYVFSGYISTLTDRQKLNHIMFIFFLFILTSSFGVLESLFGLRPVALGINYDQERTLGFFGNPNLTGLQANFSLAMIIGLFFKNKLNTLLTLILIPIVLYAAIATFSKTAIITSSLFLILFILICIRNLFKINHKSQAKNSLYVLTTLTIIIFGLILPAGMTYYDQLGTGQQKRLLSVVDVVTKGKFDRKTSSLRSDIFKDGIEIIKKDVVWGHGLSTFSIGGMFKSSPTHGVHNMFLKLFGEGGFIPLMFFIIFLCSISLKAIQNKKREYFHLCLFTMLAFSLFCLASHNVMEEKFAVALLAILVGVISDD